MAEKRDYSPYQQKVIREYYRNREGIQQQALADLVSDLYLATTDKKRASLWARAEKLLLSLEVPATRVAAIVTKRDVAGLAELAAKGFATDPRQDRRRDARESSSG